MTNEETTSTKDASIDEKKISYAVENVSHRRNNLLVHTVLFRCTVTSPRRTPLNLFSTFVTIPGMHIDKGYEEVNVNLKLKDERDNQNKKPVIFERRASITKTTRSATNTSTGIGPDYTASRSHERYDCVEALRTSTEHANSNIHQVE